MYTPADPDAKAGLWGAKSPLVIANVAGEDGTGSSSGHAYTVTGVEVGDAIAAVEHISTAASVATIADLDPTDFEISADDTVLDHSGTGDAGADYSSDQLRVTVWRTTI